jgi:hypothetical membrane protein
MGFRLTGTADPWARRGAIALIVGPLMFVLVTLIEQALRPGYTPLSNAISDLGVDTNGWSYSWMFTVSIIVLGLLTFVSAYALSRVLGKPARRGTILFGLSGVGSIGVGIFNEDAYLLPHSIFALDAFITSALALLFLAPALASRWAPVYARFSRVGGTVSLVALALFLLGVGGITYFGLFERLVVAPGLLWSLIIGVHLWHAPRLDAASAVPRLSAPDTL